MSVAGALDLQPALEYLTERERIVVEARLRGLSWAACAAAAGVPLDEVRYLFTQDRIKAAMELGKEICEAHSAINRERLSKMLLEAYNYAENATEMVLAARELAKLHGLNAPTRVEIDHNVKLKAVKTEADLKQLSLEELERLALMRGGEVLEGEFSEVRALEHAVPQSER